MHFNFWSLNDPFAIAGEATTANSAIVASALQKNESKMERIMCTPQMTITKMAITGKIGLKNCTQRLFSPLSYQHIYQSMTK
jgi:hypothetical protein